MPVYIDQLQRAVDIPQTPQRIVSLVPSLTEWLYTLQLEDAVVGITKFCVHPAQWYHNKTRIGGTKHVHIHQVAALQPDCIIASKEENVQEQVAALAAIAPVYVSDITNLTEACEAMQQLGDITGKSALAQTYIHTIRSRFAGLIPASRSLKTAYLIWQNPYMTIGGDTFIHDMLQRCGLHNLFAEQTRYPVTTIEELHALGCECLLLSTEPYPFNETHAAALRSQLPGTRVELVNGEMFSWYGSRLLEAPGYFSTLF